MHIHCLPLLWYPLQTLDTILWLPLWHYPLKRDVVGLSRIAQSLERLLHCRRDARLAEFVSKVCNAAAAPPSQTRNVRGLVKPMSSSLQPLSSGAGAELVKPLLLNVKFAPPDLIFRQGDNATATGRVAQQCLWAIRKSPVILLPAFHLCLSCPHRCLFSLHPFAC